MLTFMEISMEFLVFDFFIFGQLWYHQHLMYQQVPIRSVFAKPKIPTDVQIPLKSVVKYSGFFFF